MAGSVQWLTFKTTGSVSRQKKTETYQNAVGSIIKRYLANPG